MGEHEWKHSTLPKCFGWPCLETEHNGHIIRIWQSSPITTSVQWMWNIDNGPPREVHGNKGTVKTVALAAARRSG